MIENEETSHTILNIRWTDHSSKNLDSRIRQLRKLDRSVELEASTRAIQFLRGVASRSTFMLPAFYAQLGSSAYNERADIPYWQKVHASSIKLSSLQTISLGCRSIFDDSRKGMTGKVFSLISDETLMAVAKYWGGKTNRQTDDAARALNFLRMLFEACSRQRNSLLIEPSLLARRVGLLKFHADRQSAHISLEPYLFHLSDLSHVVAAISMIGAIIADFDMPSMSKDYFNAIDEAGWRASEESFPGLALPRLFGNFNILEQARLCWRFEVFDGLNMLLNRLPAALGWWDDESEDVRP